MRLHLALCAWVASYKGQTHTDNKPKTMNKGGGQTLGVETFYALITELMSCGEGQIDQMFKVKTSGQ